APLGEADVLAEAGVALLAAVAVGRLVANDATEADLLDRRRDAIERAVAPVGGSVVVDDARDAAFRRFDGAGHRRHFDELVVERAVEPPPDALEDLAERRGS